MRYLYFLLAIGALLARGYAVAWAAPVVGRTVSGPAHPLTEPLSYCVGLQGPEAITAARQMGLTAIEYRLPLDAPARLDEVRQELAQIHKAGLKIVLQLPTNLGYTQPQIRPSDRLYWRRLEEYVGAVVPALKNTPGLVAWQTDDFPERTVQYDADDLRLFLADRYGTLEALNQAWGTTFMGWLSVDRAAALAADDKAPWGVGVPSVDVAQWQVLTMAQVLERWAASVRSQDREHTLMTGRLSLYRTLASVPPSYDVIVPAIRPDVLEDDPLTGDVHAVDMARRGGRFQVVPTLYMPLPPSPLFHDNTLHSWIIEAAGHGARGFALDGWQRLSTITLGPGEQPQPLPPRRVAERATIIGRQTAGLTSKQVMSVNPRPCYAFLWTPYAGGLEVLKVPAYGYIEGLSQREPGDLFYSFRRGCCWGTPDYLTIEDVAVAGLDQYGVIFAPMALDLPQPVLQSLEDWVKSGGVLVADVGLGMRRTGSWRVLPQILAPVFGLAEFATGRLVAGTWQVTRPHGLLSDVRPGAKARGIVDPNQPRVAPVTARLPKAINGWAAYAAVPSTVTTVAIADTRPAPKGKGRVVAGIFAHTYGLGGGILASFRLWERWDPADPLFAAFHASLCSRRGKYVSKGGFWPAEVSLTPGEDSLAVVSRVAGITPLVAVEAGDELYSSAYCSASAEARLPDGRRSGDVTLYVETLQPGLVVLHRVGAAVRPYVGDCLSRVELAGPRALRIKIYGASAVMELTKEGARVRRVAPAPVRVLIGGGLYQVKPGSTHLVTLTSKAGTKRTFAVEADAKGKLDFNLKAQETTVEVVPAPGGE